MISALAIGVGLLGGVVGVVAWRAHAGGLDAPIASANAAVGGATASAPGAPATGILAQKTDPPTVTADSLPVAANTTAPPTAHPGVNPHPALSAGKPPTVPTAASATTTAPHPVVPPTSTAGKPPTDLPNERE